MIISLNILMYYLVLNRVIIFLLLSLIYLTYCDILNIFVAEQNGFRQNRSCIDHIFSISTIVKKLLVIINMYFVPLLILRKRLIALIEIYCFIDFCLIILMVKYLRPYRVYIKILYPQ